MTDAKRAEELVTEIGGILAPLPATYSGGRKTVAINVAASDKAAALISAEMRKVREECAERAIAKALSFKLTALDMGVWKEYRLDALSLAGLKAAILREED